MTSLPASITNDLLSAYIDGQVTAAERARVEDALVVDDQIHARLTSLKYTVNLLGEAPALAVPRAFVLSEQEVLAAGGRVRGVEQPGFWQRLLGPLTRAMPLATAAVAALLLLTVAAPRFANPSLAPLAARQEPAAEMAAAPMAAPETQLMTTESEAADMAATAMEAPAMEAPTAAQIQEEAPAEMVEEPRLFSQSGAAEKVVEETPAAMLKVAPATENTAEVADAQVELETAPPAAAQPMTMQAADEGLSMQSASAFSTLQIALGVLFVLMLAATVLLRRRALN